MRLVSHPNVVDLKAFFYSNGDKVFPHHDLRFPAVPRPSRFDATGLPLIAL